MNMLLGRRALVAVGSVLLAAWAPSAHATNFKITSTRIDPKVGGLSGTIHDTYKSGKHTQTLNQNVSIGRLELKGTSNGKSVTIDSYCVDIFSTLGSGNFSSESLSSLNLSATKLSQLSTFLENADALVSSTKNSTYSAAAQLGVWEILNETGSKYDVTSGSFYASGSDLTHSGYHQDSAVTLANSWLKDVTSNIWKPIPGAQLAMLDAVHNQGQIYVTWTPVGNPSDAPEPASWMMMISGFGAVGATLRRRSRSGRLVRS